MHRLVKPLTLALMARYVNSDETQRDSMRAKKNMMTVVFKPPKITLHMFLDSKTDQKPPDPAVSAAILHSQEHSIISTTNNRMLGMRFFFATRLII
jgi:hypothetical protein